MNLSFNHLTSNVADGNMSYIYGSQSEVFNSRSRFFSRHTLEIEDSVWMLAEHGEIIARVCASNRQLGLYTQADAVRADALITCDSRLTLALLTADCMPVVLYSPEVSVLALVHVGWKNIDNNLLVKVVNKLATDYGAEPSKIEVSIGPHISKKSYCVSNPTQTHKHEWQPFLTKANSGFYIDIAGFALIQLESTGIKKEHIHMSPVDTVTSEEYFSHHRGSRSGKAMGRFLTLAKMH